MGPKNRNLAPKNSMEGFPENYFSLMNNIVIVINLIQLIDCWRASIRFLEIIFMA